MLRRRAAGETVEQIQPDLIIPTGKRKGRNPSVASIYRALAAHEKAQAYPDAVEQAHAEHAQRGGDDVPADRAPPARPRPRPDEPRAVRPNPRPPPRPARGAHSPRIPYSGSTGNAGNGALATTAVKQSPQVQA